MDAWYSSSWEGHLKKDIGYEVGELDYTIEVDWYKLEISWLEASNELIGMNKIHWVIYPLNDQDKEHPREVNMMMVSIQ